MAVLLELPVELVELEVDDFVLLLFNPTMIPAVKLKEETLQINWALPAYVVLLTELRLTQEELFVP